MSRIRMADIRKMNKEELSDRIQSTRTELAKLRIDIAKGTLRKENGKIKPLRHDIARMLTCLREMKE